MKQVVEDLKIVCESRMKLIGILLKKSLID